LPHLLTAAADTFRLQRTLLRARCSLRRLIAVGFGSTLACSRNRSSGYAH